MAIGTHYWEKVQDNYKTSDYPEVDDNKVQFPPYIPIAYAVCGKECANRQWIVDGGPQVCERCGNLMFRTAVRWYSLMPAGFEPTEEERSHLYTVWRPDETLPMAES